MHSRFKSAVLLTLLTVFFFNTSLFGVALSTELYLHQLAQQEKIRNKKHKDIIELRIPKVLVENSNYEFQWEKSWEFRWHGEMYDIEDSRLEGDTWVYFVKHDSKEDILRKKMERHAQDETNKRNSQSKKNLKSGSEFFERFDYTVMIPFSGIVVSCEQKSFRVAAHPTVPDPPPWLV